MYAVENRYEFEDEFKVSDAEISSAVSTLKFRATILATAKMKRTLNRTRERIERRKTGIIDDRSNPLRRMEAIKEDQ